MSKIAQAGACLPPAGGLFLFTAYSYSGKPGASGTRCLCYLFLMQRTLSNLLLFTVHPELVVFFLYCLKQSV